MNEPKLEYRLRFLEKQYLNLGAHFEQLEDGMMASFKQIGELFDKSFERFDAIETRLDKIEATMATKQDISELKELIKQLIPYKSDK